MQKRLTVFLLTSLVCLSMASLALAQNCVDIHGPGTDGCAPSPLDGTEVTLTGIVYVVPGTYNSGSMYMQCPGGAGGMTLFNSSLVVELGDEVSVTGNIGAFNEEIQFASGAVVTILSNGNAETVTPIGTGDLFDGTDELGGLMSVQGVLAEVSTGFNSIYTVDDGSGPVICFADGSTGLTSDDFAPLVGNIVKITGATKCFGVEGEILPRGVDDLQLITIPTADKAWGAMKAQYK